ncbi:MAG: hypothetical protein NC253_01445 [Ruminococcus sp.]|nr:hypothetical protein [Ruminococcus sp.]MCM1480356.1 hypothetical protein [Muribaculaceae bacterium]
MTNATKLKIMGVLVKAKKFADKVSVAAVTAVTAIGTAGITASAETTTPAAAPVVDLSGVDFSGLTSSITSMVPQVLPVAVTVLGIRKAISFMMSTIRGC